MKPKGTYATADEWIQADASWQMDLYGRNEKKPRLDDPPLSMFENNSEEHEKAIRGRMRVCFRADHPSDHSRLLNPEQYNGSDKTCKICKSSKRAKTYKEQVVDARTKYTSAEAWFAEHASDTCSAHPKMTVGFCRKPVESVFETKEEYERAVVMHHERMAEYQQQIRRFKDKEAENKHKREKYAQGRREKMKREQENKKSCAAVE